MRICGIAGISVPLSSSPFDYKFGDLSLDKGYITFSVLCEEVPDLR
jgi:hypothetical protein